MTAPTTPRLWSVRAVEFGWEVVYPPGESNPVYARRGDAEGHAERKREQAERARLAEWRARMLRVDNYMLEEASELLGVSPEKVKRALLKGELSELKVFKEQGRLWFPKWRLEGFVRSPRLLRWRGLSGRELMEEFQHLRVALGDEQACQRLVAVYGLKRGNFDRMLCRYGGVLAQV